MKEGEGKRAKQGRERKENKKEKGVKVSSQCKSRNTGRKYLYEGKEKGRDKKDKEREGEEGERQCRGWELREGKEKIKDGKGE